MPSKSIWGLLPVLAAVLIPSFLLYASVGVAAAPPPPSPGPSASSERSFEMEFPPGPASQSLAVGEVVSRPVPYYPRSQATITATTVPSVPTWVLDLQRGGERTPAAGEVSVAQSAPPEANLGDWLEYTLVLTNNSSVAATVLVHDILPMEAVEDDVSCTPTCDMDVEVLAVEVNMPSQYGAAPYTRTITTVRSLSWQDVPLAAHGTKTLNLSTRVKARNDGNVLDNRVYIRYTLAGGTEATAIGNSAPVQVRVPFEPGVGTALSPEPTSYFEDYGGSASLDWGDFDRDGNIDLVLGSSAGTIVYRNEGGRLVMFWDSYLYAHDVHWADLDGDDKLELIAIGYDWWAEEGYNPYNHIYHLSSDGSRFIDTGHLALSDNNLLRVLPADYDGDGDLDLVALTYRRWTEDGCTIRLYPNDNGKFEAPHVCLYDPHETYGQTTEDLLSLGDYDNDDDLDLAVDVYRQRDPDPDNLCPYEDTFWLLTNDGGVFTTTEPIVVEKFVNCGWPSNVAWGDYNGDGYLDMAAIVPVLTGPAQHTVRIYRNRGPVAGSRFELASTFDYTDAPLAFAFSLAWGDLDADGDLDLAVAGPSLKVYLNQGGSFDENLFLSLPDALGHIPALDLALADYDNDGDLDMALADPFGNSALFTTFASPLSSKLSRIASWPASDVAWGDADSDGSQDLLFGAGASTVDAELYFNENASFGNHTTFPSSGFGPQRVAFGDMDGNGEMDVALGTIAGIQVYLAGNRDQPDWASPLDIVATSLAWADANDDGHLDLLAGRDGTTLLYYNDGQTLETVPGWNSSLADSTRSVAWADYDGDHHLDFAVGNDGQPSRVYRSNHDTTFSLAWNSSTISHTTSLAWGDYDGDGDLDLAVGNDGQPNLLYENDSGELAQTPIWHSAEVSHTTSLAWGDWDNDGDMDLAVGNDGERDQVYLNRGSEPGAPRLLWLWSSANADRTTGVAWGDSDGDGDLDLAVSSEERIGFYENFYVLPSHLGDDFVPDLRLPNQPSYLSISPPAGSGESGGAYGYASARRFSGPAQPTVTIRYRLYDGDGTRETLGSNEPGDLVDHTIFEYSLNGGGFWLPATPADGSPDPPTTTYRLGQEAVFVWDAVADEAIGDDVVFRISAIHQSRLGPVQRALTRATSPPFRVRGTTCTWPQNASIVVDDPQPDLGQAVHFVGAVDQAQGVLSFFWDFGDGTTAQWQEGNHTYTRNDNYLVQLTIRSEPCPVVKEVLVTTFVAAGTGVADTYLPIIVKGQQEE